jgi:histidinol-phosphate aminotransferase
MNNLARANISRIAGYVPGEQPRGQKFIKLNTNENPYPPAPEVGAALQSFSWQNLRLYSEPSALCVRQAASAEFSLPEEQIICGNGSDDLLTIAVRTFVDQGQPLAYCVPSYSLYPVLADLQGATHKPVNLDNDFRIPEDAAEQARGARLLLLARPNAPTGTSTARDRLEKLCQDFQGVVWIDEAYADFADDNCLDFVSRYPNVVVSRTFSKSYSLAGLRLGLAFAAPELILEMNKVKDSYNIDAITQCLGSAALRASAYMRENAARIRETRAWLAEQLRQLGCMVLPSQANFLFVRTPLDAEKVFADLRQGGFLVRYFKLPRISEYLRITIGRREDMQAFVDCLKKILS